MRPILLTIKGINSFRQMQTIDFSLLGVDNFFCITGTVGSGKTTILDCIILALYGEVSRANLVELVNISENKGEVAFTFEFEKNTYRITRTIPKKGANKAALFFGEKLVCDGVDAVNKYVKDLIGLSRDDFTQVVILEQGKFANFLKAGATQRNKTVAQLFRLDRFNNLSFAFNEQVKKISSSLEISEVKLENYKDFSREKKEEEQNIFTSLTLLANTLKEHLKEVEERLVRLSNKEQSFNLGVKSRERIAALEAQIKPLQELLILENEKLQKLTAENDKKNAANEKILFNKKFILNLAKTEKALEEIEALIQEKKVLQNDFIALKNLAEEKKERSAKCEEEAGKIAENFSDLAELSLGDNLEESKLLKAVSERIVYSTEREKKVSAAIVSLKNINADIEKLRLENVAFNTSADTLLLNKKEIENEIEDSEKTLKKLKEERENYQVEKAALVVESRLKEGDICPVCNGVYHGKTKERNSSLTFSDERLAFAEKQFSDYVKKNLLLDKEISVLQTKIQGNNSIVAEKERESAQLTLEASEKVANIARLKEIKSGYEKIVALKEEVVKLGSEIGLIEEKLKNTLESGRAKKELIDEKKKAIDFDDFVKEKERVENELAELEKYVLQLEQKKTETTENIKNISDQLLRISSALAREKEEELKTEKEFKLEEKEILENEKKDIMREYDDTLSKKSLSENYLKIVDAKLSEKKAIEEEIKALKTKLDLTEKLSRLFKRNQFSDYVSKDYILRFTFAASKTLFELSNGHYSLEFDEVASEFVVVDYLSENGKRKAKTLSGGETFLASVAVAIAISGIIANFNSYDFFFLDEGFGTLDEKSISTVLSALRQLSKNMLVGLVSHRNELTEQIASRLEVVNATDGVGSQTHII